MKTPKRKHDTAFLGFGDEYYKWRQQRMENLPVLTYDIPLSASKPKSVADLQNETWYYIKAKHTCNGMFLFDGCGGAYFELNDRRVRNCVYTPQEIKEQHLINRPETIDLTLTFTTELEAKAKIIEELTARETAENSQTNHE